MRNLKKLFAVIMVVAMLASVMVPALAADSFSYEAEAEKLYDLGLFKGNSTTEKDLDLSTELNRQAGLALAIRLMGKDAEVLAMTEEEVAEQLAKIVDANEISDWAKPYAAYAVKNGLTDGIDSTILPNVKFGPQLPLSGKEFINFVLKAMGYRVGWDDVLTKAADIGMLSAGDAVTFGTTAVMTRDMAVGVMASSLGGITADGVTLAQALVDAGAVTAEAMAAAGFFTPTVAPTEAPAVLEATASTDNLIQIKVVYSQSVDKDSAEDTDNYTVSDSEVADIALQEDGVTVILTLKAGKAQQAKVDLTIKGVKDAAGTVINETTIEDVEFFDTTIPEALDAAVVGNDTFKVTFSEPMDPATAAKGNFVVNGGKLYVKGVTFQKNNTEALVEMYSTLKEGEVTLQVKSGTEDYAGFGVIAKQFTLQVVKDEEAPVVVGYEGAKRGEVTLLWSEDLEDVAVDVTKVYHTNASNDASTVDIDGNEMKITFADEESWLPAGTAYVYVLKDAVKDLWGNKNAQQMIKVEVEVDETAPEVDGDIDVVSETEIKIAFTEALDEDSAEDEDNYTILDDEGKEVENIIDDITYADKKVTITFYDELSGDYSIVIEDVEDIYGNAIADTTVPFFVGDETKPDPDDFSAVLYNGGDEGQMVKISFGEAMATEGKYAVDDVEKYIINNVSLSAVNDVEIDVVDDGEAVEIYIPASADFDSLTGKTSGVDYLDVTADANITKEAAADVVIARVADAAGNYMNALTAIIDLQESETIDIVAGEVKATATNTITIKFEDNVAKFDVADLLVSTVSDRTDAQTVANRVYAFEIAEVDTALDSGKTVVTLTLADDMDYDLATPVYVHVIDDLSENVYGKKLTLDTKQVADKIAPEVVDDGIVFATTGNTITITFEENLSTTNDYLYAHDLIVKNRDGDTLVAEDDYYTSVSGSDLIVTIIEADFTDLEKYSIEAKATISYIKDIAGNKAKAFSKVRN